MKEAMQSAKIALVHACGAVAEVVEVVDRRFERGDQRYVLPRLRQWEERRENASAVNMKIFVRDACKCLTA